MVEGELAYLALDRKSGAIAMLLRRRDNNLLLPIWIGNPEAYSIAMALAGIKPPRPMTHDLIVDILSAINAKLSRVVITGLKNETFYALLHIDRGETETYVIDARPSDSIALAVRTGCPIFLSEDMQYFDLDNPKTPLEQELSQILSRLSPDELIGF
ncbi:bifunctional nuclease family protein [bacterium]|nr:bifunctional nuclease family protein [bacterium]